MRHRHGVPRDDDDVKEAPRPSTTNARILDTHDALEALRALSRSTSPPVAAERKTRPLVATKPHHIIWASDVHFPEEDPVAWSCFLARAADAQPDEIILGGDIMEMESASRHGGVAQPAQLVEEIEYTRTKLAELRALCPDAHILYLEGNHETRLGRAVVEALPTFEGALSLPSLLSLDEMRIEWHAFGRVVRRGKCGFVHGKYTNVHHAQKHLTAFGESLVYGHTHRPQATHMASPHGVRGAYGMPCLRTLEPEWMVGAPTGWVHGWGEVWIDEPSGHYNCYTVIVIDGRALVDGRLYTGRGG